MDLDISRFRVTKNVRLAKVKPIVIVLTVRNGGAVDEPRMATVIGTQNGVEVYNQTQMVSDAVGDGSSRVFFTPFVPDDSGDIRWVATIDDDDPDVDMATAVTSVR